MQDSDTKHLHWLKKTIGDRLRDAIVINTGPRAYRRPDGIGVVPFALLGFRACRARVNKRVHSCPGLSARPRGPCAPGGPAGGVAAIGQQDYSGGRQGLKWARGSENCGVWPRNPVNQSPVLIAFAAAG